MSTSRSNDEWLEGLRSRLPAEKVVADLGRALEKGLRRALASRAGVSDTDVEDFAQEATLRVLDRVESFRGDSKFTTWALSIAIRVALTKIRRRSWGERSLEELGLPSDGAASPRVEIDTESAIDRARLLEALREAIARDLTARQRTVVLAELAGMPSAVLADELGIQRNALYKLHHDARKKLRETLERAGYSAREVSSLLAAASTR